jgi:UDP-N-acetylglucosamine 2-epimerase (non-hydrolysing)
VLATGQHRDLVEPMLAFFAVAADRDLALMEDDQPPGHAAGRMLAAMDTAVAAELPDIVLAEGDTSTVLTTALACFYRRVPFAHVEAGLRSGDFDEPFPEEMHRVVVGRLAALHLAPTDDAAAHLRDEGVDPATVVITGNPVIDALHWAIERVEPARGDHPRRRILVTAHRRENAGPRLTSICDAIRRLVRERDVDVVFPVHPNPAIARTVRDALAAEPRVDLCAPLGYAECVVAMRDCDLILTDSGGIQEEAPALGKPVLVLRQRTERSAGISAGGARLVGTDADAIVRATCELLDDPSAYAAMAQTRNPYGDGHAARRIADALEAFFLSRTPQR